MARLDDANVALAREIIGRYPRPKSALIPLLHLALSRVLAVGARLGATQDVVPSERFEPDTGPEVDMDPLRLSLRSPVADEFVHAGQRSG